MNDTTHPTKGSTRTGFGFEPGAPTTVAITYDGVTHLGTNESARAVEGSVS